MEDNFDLNYRDFPAFSCLKNNSMEGEDYPLVDNLGEYNAEIEKLQLSGNKRGEVDQIIPEVLYSEDENYFINSKIEDLSLISEDKNDQESYAKYLIPESLNEIIKKLKESNLDNEINLKSKLNINKDEGKKKRKKYKKNKKNKGEKLKLIEEDKKNRFISLKLFNPKGENEECKKIREEINKIISENKTVSDPSAKKEKNLFFIYVQNPQVIKRRKENTDNLRKKVKNKFLKSFKNRINMKLKVAKSEYLFDYFPKIFSSNITKKENKIIINKKLVELLKTNFFEEYNKKNIIENEHEKKINEKKYYHNLEVLKYLEENENVKKKINFDYIKEMTFEKMFKEYLESKEFEEDILELKKKKEKPEYIKNYIVIAYTFIEYFSE